MMLGVTGARASRKRGSLCRALTRPRPLRLLMCIALPPLPAVGQRARTRRLLPTTPLPSLLRHRLPLARL